MKSHLTGLRFVLVPALLAATTLLAAPAKAASLQQVSNWSGGVANLPSDVPMYVYVPDKVATNPPILTLIHSCDSNASVVLGQAPDLKSAADKYGFIIVVPQSNPSSLRCWTTDSTQKVSDCVLFLLIHSFLLNPFPQLEQTHMGPKRV